MEELLISNLTLLDTNPRQVRKGAIERLAKSISSERGKSLFNKRPCLVNKRDGKLIVYAGNQRLRAAQSLGWKTVPCIVEEITLEEEREETIKDNLVIGEWDDDLLANHFDIEELADWGMDLSDLKLDTGEIEEDEAPEPPTEARTKLGQIFTLGRHRLMCGDSTCVEAVDKLMDGVIPDLIHTDPPYGMNAVSSSGVLSKNYKQDILGDDNPNVAKDAFNLIYAMYPDSKHIWWGANYYSSVLPDSECWIVWDKNNGGSDQTDCELAWANFRSVVRQFTQSSEKVKRVHPTQKPVSLMEWIIKRFKITSSTIADYFGGSGTTLIAAERNGIKSYLMELDPKYCDVIIQRYCNFTNTDIEDIYGQA